MQTLILDNLPTPVLLVWELPEDAEVEETDFNIRENKYVRYWLNGKDYLEDLPEWITGNWQLIGKLSELTEEQAQTIVFRSRIGKYKDYKPATVSKEADSIGLINALLEMSKDTALESFHSAIESEGYHMPTPKPLVSDYDNYDHVYGGNTLSPEEAQEYAKELKKWQEAQSKTLPANTLIFKRV